MRTKPSEMVGLWAEHNVGGVFGYWGWTSHRTLSCEQGCSRQECAETWLEVTGGQTKEQKGWRASIRLLPTAPALPIPPWHSHISSLLRAWRDRLRMSPVRERSWWWSAVRTRSSTGFRMRSCSRASRLSTPAHCQDKHPLGDSHLEAAGCLLLPPHLPPLARRGQVRVTHAQVG